jgi:hypothetical protein
MRKLRQQLQLDNCALPFLFLSKRGKPRTMDTARKINFYKLSPQNSFDCVKK